MKIFSVMILVLGVSTVVLAGANSGKNQLSPKTVKAIALARAYLAGKKGVSTKHLDDYLPDTEVNSFGGPRGTIAIYGHIESCYVTIDDTDLSIEEAVCH